MLHFGAISNCTILVQSDFCVEFVQIGRIFFCACLRGRCAPRAFRGWASGALSASLLSPSPQNEERTDQGNYDSDPNRVLARHNGNVAEWHKIAPFCSIEFWTFLPVTVLSRLSGALCAFGAVSAAPCGRCAARRGLFPVRDRRAGF
jgi:hypothetical protein